MLAHVAGSLRRVLTFALFAKCRASETKPQQEFQKIPVFASIAVRAQIKVLDGSSTARLIGIVLRIDLAIGNPILPQN